MTLPANDRAYCELLQSLKVGMIAFVGAGTSVSCGYPTWQKLLAMLQDEANDHAPHPPRELTRYDEDDFLWTADELRRRLGEDRYLGFLRKTFQPRPSDQATALRRLAQLPLKDFLTTNFDSLIEAVVGTPNGSGVTGTCWSNADALREFWARLTVPRKDRDDRRVVHVHGKWDQADSVVLTERDYKSRYVSSDTANRLLFSLFATQAILFVGFSLSDPDLNAILRQVQACLGHGPPRHFAIIGLKDWSDESSIRRRLEGKFGVSPLFYPIVPRETHDSHEALDILLARLAEDLVRDRNGASPTDGAGIAPQGVDPADPHKNAFGGKSEVDGFALTGTVSNHLERNGWFSVQLKVVGNPSRVLSGRVTFHLHPSFRNRRRVVTPSSGEAELRLLAYGAFTVGATIDQDGREIQLELDLATVETAPEAFRKR